MKARLKGFTDESTGEVQNVRLREISEESIIDRDVDGAIGSIEEALRAYIAKLEPSAHSQVLEVKSYLNGEKPEVEPLTLDASSRRSLSAQRKGWKVFRVGKI
jgi:hypothetical protein